MSHLGTSYCTQTGGVGAPGLCFQHTGSSVPATGVEQCPKSQLLGGTGMRQEKGSVPVVQPMYLVLAAEGKECLYHSQTWYVGGVFHPQFSSWTRWQEVGPRCR